MVENLPSNAGDVALIPGCGTKILHTAGQLSLHTGITEPHLERSLFAAMEDPVGCS